jgi:2-dehydro-3-deoxygluconokinase
MIVAFGEAMLRLAPPNFQRIEQARSFDVEVGGTELNTLASLARLGHATQWVSALPENAMGRLVLNRVREAGVGTDHVLFDEEGRCGLYFVEFGASPRASTVTYDRAASSVSQVSVGSSSFWSGWKPGTFDWKTILAGQKWFHLTGITPALGENCAEAAKEAIGIARDMGLRISFDINFRSKLWTATEACRVLRGLIHGVDLLIATEEDGQQLFGITPNSYGELAKHLSDKYAVRFMAAIRREAPRVWQNRIGGVGYHNGTLLEEPMIDVEIVDRLGAGDAFVAGVIHGLMESNFEKGLQYGTAMAALQHTTPGDLPWFTLEDIEAVLDGDGLRIKR